MPISPRQRVVAATNQEKPDSVLTRRGGITEFMIRQLAIQAGLALRQGFLALAFVLSTCGRQSTVTYSPTNTSVLARVPAGWFWMGEDDGRASNQPRHHTYLDAFEIMVHEVTREEFARFLTETDYRAVGWSEETQILASGLPAAGILWQDAATYCLWLGMRLPTEAEWEKAARGEDGRRYPWGDGWEIKKANTAESGVGDVIPVGSLSEGASPYGLFDMSGNVAEWLADFYDPDYYSISPERNPTGPNLVVDHVLRGGSFASTAEEATTYFRDSSHSVRPNPRVGFRCARSIPSAVP